MFRSTRDGRDYYGKISGSEAVLTVTVYPAGEDALLKTIHVPANGFDDNERTVAFLTVVNVLEWER